MNNKKIFAQHGRRRRKRNNPMPTLHIKNISIAVRPDENPFSWDTDRITFVVDNSATAIIRNKRNFFTGQLTPITIKMKKAEGLTTNTNLAGAIRLVLTNDINEHRAYTIPGYVFDPESPINILVIPTLGKFFGDNVYVHSPIA